MVQMEWKTISVWTRLKETSCFKACTQKGSPVSKIATAPSSVPSLVTSSTTMRWDKHAPYKPPTWQKRRVCRHWPLWNRHALSLLALKLKSLAWIKLLLGDWRESQMPLSKKCTKTNHWNWKIPKQCRRPRLIANECSVLTASHSNS